MSWSHYCELLSISDKEKRSFYEKEAVNSGWSVREMKRQVESSLFERLLLSRGDANKEQVLALAEKGVDYTKPEDIIKDPYVFEFLGLPEEKPFLESDLEAALVRQIEDLLLELGRGFMFVGTQQRVTVNNTHYYVDMVFYNKILHAYVLIELKTTKLTPEAAGQINMYLNYYAAEVNDPEDNPPIGIILCTDKDSIAAEYALGGLSNQILHPRYVLVYAEQGAAYWTGGRSLEALALSRRRISLPPALPLTYHQLRIAVNSCVELRKIRPFYLARTKAYEHL